MLTLTERERLAYINGETILANLIYANRGGTRPAISPEIKQRLMIATLHERERIAYANGEHETHALILAAELGADAISDAESALERCDAQIDDTLAEKLQKMTADRLDAANAEKLAQLDTELASSGAPAPRRRALRVLNLPGAYLRTGPIAPPSPRRSGPPISSQP